MNTSYRVSEQTEQRLGREMYYVIDATETKVTTPAGIQAGCYASRATAQRVADHLTAGHVWHPRGYWTDADGKVL